MSDPAPTLEVAPLPCPHCGGPAEVKFCGSDIKGQLFSVRCWKCIHVDSKAAAIASWNRRVTLEETRRLEDRRILHNILNPKEGT